MKHGPVSRPLAFPHAHGTAIPPGSLDLGFILDLLEDFPAENFTYLHTPIVNWTGLFLVAGRLGMTQPPGLPCLLE